MQSMIQTHSAELGTSPVNRFVLELLLLIAVAFGSLAIGLQLGAAGAPSQSGGTVVAGSAVDTSYDRVEQARLQFGAGSASDLSYDDVEKIRAGR